MKYYCKYCDFRTIRKNKYEEHIKYKAPKLAVKSGSNGPVANCKGRDDIKIFIALLNKLSLRIKICTLMFSVRIKNQNSIFDTIYFCTILKFCVTIGIVDIQ